MTRVTTFNVNQHSTLANIEADLEARMADSDVVLCQETVKIDLAAFAACQKGWAAFQVRSGNNDGHANTGVLYRKSLGAPTATDCSFVGDAKDTRPRFLAAVEFNGREWYGSVHVFPSRDRSSVPSELAAVGVWVAKHDAPIVLGLDKNHATVPALEKATGLKWHGVDIDGFLTNVPIADVAAFKPGFSDHPGVHGVVTIPAQPKPKPGPVPPPHPVYLGPAAHIMHDAQGHPLENKPIGRIVIHSTVSPCKPGGARQIAAFFRSPVSGGSAHYVVDPGEDVQVVFDSEVAEHAPPNQHSLGIEMCDTPGPVPGDKPGSAAFKAARKAWRWRRPEQQQMLERTAKLAAQLCAAYHVPPVFLSVRALKAGKHGVTTHNNVSQAFHQSTHWDPGFWPRHRFMRMVKAEHKRLTGA